MSSWRNSCSVCIDTSSEQPQLLDDLPLESSSPIASLLTEPSYESISSSDAKKVVRTNSNSTASPLNALVVERALELLRQKTQETEGAVSYESRGSLLAIKADAESFVLEEAMRLLEGSRTEGLPLSRLQRPLKQRKASGLSSVITVSSSPRYNLRQHSEPILKSHLLGTTTTGSKSSRIYRQSSTSSSGGYRTSSDDKGSSPVRGASFVRPSRFFGDSNETDSIFEEDVNLIGAAEQAAAKRLAKTSQSRQNDETSPRVKGKAGLQSLLPSLRPKTTHSHLHVSKSMSPLLSSRRSPVFSSDHMPLPEDLEAVGNKVLRLEFELDMANATIHELRGEITNHKDAQCILKIEMEDLKNIVSVRKSEIEKLEESLQKMTDAEEQARDSCNAALQQVIAMQTSHVEMSSGPEETAELDSMKHQMKQAVQVIQALKDRIEKQNHLTSSLQTQKTECEVRLKAFKQELEARNRTGDDDMQAKNNQIHDLRNQLAKTIAAYVSTKTHAEKSSGEREEKLHEADRAIAKLKKEKSHLEDNVNELLKRCEPVFSTHVGIQTEKQAGALPARLKSWLWLLTLQLAQLGSDNDALPDSFFGKRGPRCKDAEIQCDGVEDEDDANEAGGMIRRARVATCTTAAQTDVVLQRLETPEDTFWKQVVARAESEARVEELPIYYKRTDAMILTIMSSVYSEKSIADFMDTQRHQLVQPLSSFLWMWMLKEWRDKDRAKKEMEILVINLLFRTRARPSARYAVHISNHKTGRDTNRIRMMHFARFLGFWVNDPLDPTITLHAIPIGGLEVYLTVLVRSRMGECPLLESSVVLYEVRFDAFVGTIDYVLAPLRFHEREAVKTEISHINNNNDVVDLDLCLDVMLKVWLEVDSRFQTRLEALFVAHDIDGNGNLDCFEYYDMMRKIDEEETINESLTQRRIYAKMCVHDRVDQGIFTRSARETGLDSFKMGTGDRIFSKEQLERAHNLRVMHMTAAKTIKESAPLLVECPDYPVMMSYLRIVDAMVATGTNPEVGFVAFYHASRLFSSMMNVVRRGRTWADVRADVQQKPDTNVLKAPAKGAPKKKEVQAKGGPQKGPGKGVAASAPGKVGELQRSKSFDEAVNSS